MVFGPGGYRFSDYVRLGLPLADSEQTLDQQAAQQLRAETRGIRAAGLA